MQEAVCELKLCNDSNIAFNQFSTIITQVTEVCYPMRTITIKDFLCKLWITRDVKELIKSRHKLYNKYVNKYNLRGTTSSIKKQCEHPLKIS